MVRKQIAGPSYYTGCCTHRDSKTLELWLASAPAELLAELEEMHPRIYVIHNDAPRPEAVLFELMDALPVDRLKDEGIRVVRFGPTHDRYLHVSVMGDVPTAQARLDPCSAATPPASSTASPYDTWPVRSPDTRLG